MKTYIGEQTLEEALEDGGVDLSLTSDPAGVLALMEALISLYSNGEQAVLREYTSNGRDASKKGGWFRPVEVSLPTVQHPVLVVEDWGIGMTAA
jgi:HSP90 family molecular chaperone